MTLAPPLLMNGSANPSLPHSLVEVGAWIQQLPEAENITPAVLLPVAVNRIRQASEMFNPEEAPTLLQ